MEPETPKRTAGRPKTLDRLRVLEVAMKAYWTEGPDSVSINEVCKRAGVSKPGVYREFGNEDGLKQAVLKAYQQEMLRPIYEMIAIDKPFRESLEELISTITTLNEDKDAPKGCLLVKMRESYTDMGDATQEQINYAKQQALTAYKNWVERAKAKKEFKADMTSDFAASYLDAQLNNALTLISQGEPNNTVKKIVTTALAMLT